MATVLEQYLDFVSPDEIMIRGTRIAIQTVIYAYRTGWSAEEIQQQYPSLNAEQVYGVIAYYLAHKSEMDAYILRNERRFEEARRRQREGPAGERIRRLRAMRAKLREL